MSLRCAVVGVGHLGRFHAQKYKMIPQATLVGVCDASKEQAEKVAAEFQAAVFFGTRLDRKSRRRYDRGLDRCALRSL